MLNTPNSDDEIPEPEDVFVDPTHPRPDEAVAALSDVGLLTERQAEAYVRRVLELEPREAVARHLDISPSTLDDHRSVARELVTQARKTVAILDAYRHPEFPTECADCGDAFGRRWVVGREEPPLCLDCAGVDDGA